MVITYYWLYFLLIQNISLIGLINFKNILEVSDELSVAPLYYNYSIRYSWAEDAILCLSSLPRWINSAKRWAVKVIF